MEELNGSYKMENTTENRPMTQELLKKILVSYPEIRLYLDLIIFNQYELTFFYQIKATERKNVVQLRSLKVYLSSLFLNVLEIKCKRDGIMGYQVSDLKRHVRELHTLNFYCKRNTLDKILNVRRRKFDVLPTRFYYSDCEVNQSIRTQRGERRSTLINYLINQIECSGEARLPLQGYDIRRLMKVIQKLDLDLYFGCITAVMDKDEELSVAILLKHHKSYTNNR